MTPTEAKTELLAVRGAVQFIRGWNHSTLIENAALFVITKLDAVIKDMEAATAGEQQDAYVGVDPDQPPPNSMGDVSKTQAIPAASPASVCQSEITEAANEALTRHINISSRAYESFADYKQGFFDGYDTAKRHPVSLEKCAIALYWSANRFGGLREKCESWENQDEIMKHDYRNEAKAVLDAAGVKYDD